MPAFESDWKAALGDSFLAALREDQGEGKLDLGCIAGHGYFHSENEAGEYRLHSGGKPATAVLFKLLSQLQFSGTVPMIDNQAYAAWISDEPRRFLPAPCYF